MKKKLLILPLIALFSMTSCGTSAPDKTADGHLPSGGSEVTKKEDRTARLAKVIENGSAQLGNLDAFGLELSFDISKFSVDSPNLKAELAVSPQPSFKMGAEHLFNGTKENTKIGVSSTAFTASVKMETSLTEEPVNLNESFSIGALGAYLDNGNVYADLSALNVPNLLKQVVKAAAPFADTLKQDEEGYGMMIGNLIEQFSLNPDLLQTMLDMIFGKDFNYKLKFEDVAKEFPLVKVESYTETESLEKAEEAIKAFDNNTAGLKFDEVCHIYTYGDFTGLQFSFDLNKIEAVANAGVTLGEGNVFEFGIVMDEKGLPRDFSIKAQLDLSVAEEQAGAIFGGALKASGGVKVNGTFVYGSNPVSFPANYDDYSKLAFDVGGLFGF